MWGIVSPGARRAFWIYVCPWASWNCRLPGELLHLCRYHQSVNPGGNKALITPLLKTAMDEPLAFFRGLSDINHVHQRYRKDLFKSSELCCRTCCCLLLGALSQWIGLCLGEQMNTGFFFFCLFSQVDMKEKSPEWRVFNYLSLLLWIINDFSWVMPPLSLYCNSFLLNIKICVVHWSLKAASTWILSLSLAPLE